MSKPREYFIMCDHPDDPISVHLEKGNGAGICGYIHVIEKSAYTELEAKYFELKANPRISGDVIHKQDLRFIALKDKADKLAEALEFYTSRTVYERLNQFPGDDCLSECGDIAEQALKEYRGESDE